MTPAGVVNNPVSEVDVTFSKAIDTGSGYTNMAAGDEALQGYSQTVFFYGQLGGVFFDPTYAPFISRDLAIATRTIRGGSAFGIYPLDRYRRLELSGGLIQLDEQYNDPTLQAQATAYQQSVYGQPVFRNGTLMPLGAAFVQETTIFREFGPLAGNTMRVAYDVSPPIHLGNSHLLSRQTVDVDARRVDARDHGSHAEAALMVGLPPRRTLTVLPPPCAGSTHSSRANERTMKSPRPQSESGSCGNDGWVEKCAPLSRTAIVAPSLSHRRKIAIGPGA